MQILAIETTDLTGSVAVLDGPEVLQMRDLPAQPRSAVTLAPAIDELLSAVGWKPADVKLLGVATGPGSFTGLRVGVTTAKMFAYAVGAEVVGVNALAAIAWQSPPDVNDVWAVIDAQRQQLFASRCRRDAEGQWQTVVETQLFEEASWLAELAEAASVSGPALSKFKSRLPSQAIALDESFWQPKAATIGKMAWQRFQNGFRDSVWTLAPQYFRLSAAEEKARSLSK